MEKLLKWSAAAQHYDPNTDQEPPKPDSQALNELFGGADEATQMKQALAAAITIDNSTEDRKTALDNLEMLIEQIDNANNLENMGLWEPLLGLLDDPDAGIRKMTCWVVGTATQNNPQSQAALAKQDGAVAKLLKMVENDEDQDVRLKALYALSSEVGHNPLGYEQFRLASGWTVLEKLFNTVDHSRLRMRILAFLQVIAQTDPVEKKHDELDKTNILDSMVNIMKDSGHVDAEEKALFVCSTLFQNGFKFTDEQLEQIKQLRHKIVQQSEGGIVHEDVPFAA